MNEASWEAKDPSVPTWAEILSFKPLIIYGLPSIGYPMGCASAVGPLIKDRVAHFLLGQAWTMEPPDNHRPLIEAARHYLADHPLHRVTFLGNTPAETAIFASAGFAAITLNHNLLVDDTPFHPMPGVTPLYDAVYNARLSPEKRPELAADLARAAFIYFFNGFEASVAQFHAEQARLRALMPRVTFVNKLTPQGCEWLLPNQINSVFAQSRVGLCLSAVEGAMRASIEYLFAGLPVVSTPSLGGRDQYFDAEYCIVADPDPRAIRNAVEQLIARDVPRSLVRARTMARIDADRARYIAYVQALIDRVGGDEKFADRFWSLLRGAGIMRWRPMTEFSQTVLSAIGDDTSKRSEIESATRKELWRPADPTGSAWSEILSVDPLVIHTWRTDEFPLGSASVVGPLVKERPAHFLVASAWTVEPAESRDFMVAAMWDYLAEHPNHRLTFIGNNDPETNLMKLAGVEAFTLNHNALMDELKFRPLSGVTPIYDAVYNGRLSVNKRTDLAAQVENLVLVYFYNPFEHTVPEFHAAHARLSSMMPKATFINKLTPDGCEWIPPEQINYVMAQSRVGLCLSPVEGAMRASIEYLFAGLSIVSTPSFGGREHYFDDEYCIIADPEPGAVRSAVDQIVARAVPRAYVRARTMARIEADRAKYIAFVQAIIDQGGGREKFADRFYLLTRGSGIMHWRSMTEFSKTVLESL